MCDNMHGMSDVPDVPFDPCGFADSWWDHRRRLDAFEDHLLYAGDEGFDFEKTWTDSYDSSIEIGKVPPGTILNAAQQALLAACGFRKVYVNYSDGTEKVYDLRTVMV